MYSILLQTHHYIAFISIALLAFATLKGFLGANKEEVFEETNRKINAFALISTHIMLLLGIILLCISPLAKIAFEDMGAAMKNPELRKMIIEHPFTNIIAVILATIGNAKSKKAIGNGRKFKVSYIYFGLALLLLLSRLPYDRIF